MPWLLMSGKDHQTMEELALVKNIIGFLPRVAMRYPSPIRAVLNQS